MQKFVEQCPEAIQRKGSAVRKGAVAVAMDQAQNSAVNASGHDTRERDLERFRSIPETEDGETTDEDEWIGEVTDITTSAAN